MEENNNHANLTKTQVRFFSHDLSITIPNVSIHIPTNLRRFGLSEIVKQLLSLRGDDSVPFEFLIQGKLLTTDIQAFLDERGWSSENVLELEVVKARTPPEQGPSKKIDNWISDVAAVHAAHGEYLAVADFAGCLQVINLNDFQASTDDVETRPAASSLDKVQIGQMQVKKVEPFILNDSLYLLSVVGYDTVLLKVTEDDKKQSLHLNVQQRISEHQDTVETFALLQKQGQVVATGSWDQTIRIFKMSATPSEPSTMDVTLKKKRKDAEPATGDFLSYSCSLLGHSGAVSCLASPATTASEGQGSSSLLYSGSWDHSLRSWDLNTVEHVRTWMPNAAVFCLDIQPQTSSGLLVSGHADHHLDIWDPRVKDSTRSVATLAGHKGFVSKVKWSLSDPHTLFSIGLDGCLKVWDTRNVSSSVATLYVGDDRGKLFALSLAGGTTHQLYCGGEEGLLASFSV